MRRACIRKVEVDAIHNERFIVLLALLEVPSFGCNGDDADVCASVDCRGWGVCKAIDEAPVCMCDPGYVWDGESRLRSGTSRSTFGLTKPTVGGQNLQVPSR